MKKLYISSCCILLIFIQAFAQNNPAEAKAAYLLAEDEFNAGKYESAISYLNQARCWPGSRMNLLGVTWELSVKPITYSQEVFRC